MYNCNLFKIPKKIKNKVDLTATQIETQELKTTGPNMYPSGEKKDGNIEDIIKKTSIPEN